MRIYFPLVFVLAAIVWLVYLMIIKKDFKKTKQVVGVLVFFSSIWAALYYFILN